MVCRVCAHSTTEESEEDEKDGTGDEDQGDEAENRSCEFISIDFAGFGPIGDWVAHVES